MHTLHRIWNIRLFSVVTTSNFSCCSGATPVIVRHNPNGCYENVSYDQSGSPCLEGTTEQSRTHSPTAAHDAPHRVQYQRRPNNRRVTSNTAKPTEEPAHADIELEEKALEKSDRSLVDQYSRVNSPGNDPDSGRFITRREFVDSRLKDAEEYSFYNDTYKRACLHKNDSLKTKHSDDMLVDSGTGEDNLSDDLVKPVPVYRNSEHYDPPHTIRTNRVPANQRHYSPALFIHPQKANSQSPKQQTRPPNENVANENLHNGHVGYHERMNEGFYNFLRSKYNEKATLNIESKPGLKVIF